MVVHFLIAGAAAVVCGLLLASAALAGLTLFVALVIDVDHVFDYWLARGFSLDPRKFWQDSLNGRYFEQSGRILVLFHAWEFLPVGWVVATVFGGQRVLLAFSLGFFVHLVWDQLCFAKRPLMYSLIFRARHRFRLDRICAVVE